MKSTLESGYATLKDALNRGLEALQLPLCFTSYFSLNTINYRQSRDKSERRKDEILGNEREIIAEISCVKPREDGNRSLRGRREPSSVKSPIINSGKVENERRDDCH